MTVNERLYRYEAEVANECGREGEEADKITALSQLLMHKQAEAEAQQEEQNQRWQELAQQEIIPKSEMHQTIQQHQFAAQHTQVRESWLIHEMSELKKRFNVGSREQQAQIQNTVSQVEHALMGQIWIMREELHLQKERWRVQAGSDGCAHGKRTDGVLHQDSRSGQSNKSYYCPGYSPGWR